MCWIRQQTTNEGESCNIKIQPFTYAVTGKTLKWIFFKAYKRAQVIVKKTSHTCLALSSSIPMKVKHYPIRTALLYALKEQWTTGESFLRQHLLSHLSVKHKPLTSSQRHLLNKHAGGLEDSKLHNCPWVSLHYKDLGELLCEKQTLHETEVTSMTSMAKETKQTMKFLPCISIWNEFFLNGIFRRNYQDVRILPPLVNVKIWSQVHISL